jgi:hypothetical protein
VVSLEFNKLVEQVEKFGRMAGKFDFDVGDLLQVAMERLAAAWWGRQGTHIAMLYQCQFRRT